MAPDPGGVRTVGCSLEKLIPDAVVLSDIRTVVERVHLATIQVCLLLNVHVRRCLQYNISLERIFDGNYLVKAFYEVTVGDTSSCQKDPELTKSRALLENVHGTQIAHTYSIRAGCQEKWWITQKIYYF